MKWKWLALSALLAAFWPLWTWLGERWLSPYDDARWNMLAPALGLFACFIRRKESQPDQLPLWAPGILVTIYGISWPLLPHLISGFFAMSALALLASRLWLGRSWHLGLMGLFVLGLPVIPSLQIYLGYPMRLAAGEIAAWLLSLSGPGVQREGLSLVLDTMRVSIDAPCSGVKMLWTGLFATGIVATYLELGSRQTLILSLLSLLAIVLGNAFRVASLFYMEAGLFHGPGWLHEGSGLLTFFIVTGLIAMAGTRLSKDGPWTRLSF